MTDKSIKIWHTFTRGYNSVTRRNEMLPFVNIMKLNGVMLNKINQKKKDRY